MEAAESWPLREVAESGLGESYSQVFLVEDGVVVVEEGQAEDPERSAVRDVHVHDLEQTEAAVALNVVLAGHRVILAIDRNCHVGVRTVLGVGALTHEQVPQLGVHPAGIVPLEVVSERTEVT